MDENNFEVFRSYLLFILSVFWWAKTLLKHSHTYLISILSKKKERSLRIRFAIEFKLFRMIEKKNYNLRILFAIDFRRFRMNKNNFEVFRWYLLFILSVFWWAKTLLKYSHTCLISILGVLILSKKKKRSLRIRFAIEFKLFWMIENTFITFAFF